MMGHNQPRDGCRQRWQFRKRSWRGFVQSIAPITAVRHPARVIPIGRRGQTFEPCLVVVAADEGRKKTQRNPFVAVKIFLEAALTQARLEGHAGLAKIMQQRRHLREQLNVLAGMPIVLAIAAQHIARRRVRGHGTLGIEASRVAYDPHQLAVIASANPVAGNRGVAASGFP